MLHQVVFWRWLMRKGVTLDEGVTLDKWLGVEIQLETDQL